MDIVNKLNELNISLQGKDNLIVNTFNHIRAFQKKLLLFESLWKINNAHHFPMLKEFKKSKCNNYIKYVEEIRKLVDAFESPFNNLELKKENTKFFEIYSSPFHVEIESVPEYLQMDLIDIQCNNELKRMFENSESKIDFFFNIYVT